MWLIIFQTPVVILFQIQVLKKVQISFLCRASLKTYIINMSKKWIVVFKYYLHKFFTLRNCTQICTLENGNQSLKFVVYLHSTISSQSYAYMIPTFNRLHMKLEEIQLLLEKSLSLLYFGRYVNFRTHSSFVHLYFYWFICILSLNFSFYVMMRFITLYSFYINLLKKFLH